MFYILMNSMKKLLLLILILLSVLTTGCAVKPTTIATDKPCNSWVVSEFNIWDTIYYADIGKTCHDTYSPYDESDYNECRKNYKEFCNQIDINRCPSYIQSKWKIVDIEYSISQQQIKYTIIANDEYTEQRIDESNVASSPAKLEKKFQQRILNELDGELDNYSNIKQWYFNSFNK